MTDQFVTKTTLERMVKKAQSLLTKAEATQDEFPAEAAECRRLAEQIMRKYRIAEESLIAEDPAAVEPEWTSIDIFSKSSDFRGRYFDLLWYAASHAGCRVYGEYRWDRERDTRVVHARLVGYPGDVRAAEFLFTQAKMAFQEALEPEIKPELGDQLNCFRLRQAGVERWRIAQMLWGSDPKDGAAHGKVARLYKAECAARGISAAVTGRNVNAKTYREAYSDEFLSAFVSRLRVARDGADSTGGALVLSGRQERVEEAFYTAYPHMRPSTDVVKREACEACAKTKSASGKCRNHQARKVTQAQRARVERLYYSDAAMAGRSAGRDAAESIELDRADRAKRIEDGADPAAKRAAAEILGR